MKRTLKSLEDTQQLAKELVEHLDTQKSAVVIALIGDLGAGKTTFTQYIAEALDVSVAIQSPTFLIEKIYELHQKPWQHLIHIDAYRLEKEEELLSLGWREIISKKENIIVVEWADKVKNILPESAIYIVFNHGQETERQVEISAA